MSLLRCLIREEDKSNTHFGPQDIKDGLNTMLFFIDQVTWPQVLKQVISYGMKERRSKDWPVKRAAQTFWSESPSSLFSPASSFKATRNSRREWRL